MPITLAQMQPVVAQLQDWSLREVPDDNRAALRRAGTAERRRLARHGFTPAAVCFNCGINRRTHARLPEILAGLADRRSGG